MPNTVSITPDHEIAKHLCAADKRLCLLIQAVGLVEFTRRDHYFEALAMSIIGQQLSPKAAGTIARRVKELCPDFTPRAVMDTAPEALRAAGLSAQKLSYIRDLSIKVMENLLPFDRFDQYDNDAVIQALTSVKGIGRWTSEMFLIFSLGRLNVLSLGDAGLQRAAKWLYRMPDRADGKYLEQHGHNWAPYPSIASLYLWEAIDQGLVNGELAD